VAAFGCPLTLWPLQCGHAGNLTQGIHIEGGFEMLNKSLFVMFVVLVAIGCMIHSADAQTETRWLQVTDRYGNTLKIEQNPVTKAAHRVYGLKGDISLYGIPLAALNQENIDDAAKRFLSDYQEIIKVGSDDLVLRQASHRKGK